MTMLVLLIALQVEHRDASPPAPPEVDVCDVLVHDPTRLNGKLVRVRGHLVGTDEGAWLIGECKSHLVTKGLQWGNDISIYVQASNPDILRAWEKAQRKIGELHPASAQDQVWITIIGQLRTRASMDDEVVQMPYGLRRSGFGHMGGSAAEIRVIAVEDISIRHQSPDTK